jgi:hypothetical protein
VYGGVGKGRMCVFCVIVVRIGLEDLCTCRAWALVVFGVLKLKLLTTIPGEHDCCL